MPRRVTNWLFTMATVILLLTPGVALSEYDFVIEATSDTFVAVEPESAGVYHFTLSNTGTEDDVYAMTAVDSIPDDWFGVLCYKDRCVPAGVTVYDSIAAGDQDTTIEVTITTTAEWDLGLVTLQVESEGDPSLVDSIRVWCLIGAYLTMVPLDDTMQTVTGGETASCRMALTNMGSFEDTLEIQLTDGLPNGWDGWFELGGESYSFGDMAYDTLARSEGDTVVVYMSTASEGGEGSFWLRAMSTVDPEVSDSILFHVTAEPSGWVSELPGEGVGSQVRLEARPNPFQNTAILWCNPGTSLGVATVKIYDTVGRLVVNLYEGGSWEGVRSITWDASDLPGGIYFVRLMVGGETIAKRKLTLIR